MRPAGALAQACFVLALVHGAPTLSKFDDVEKQSPNSFPRPEESSGPSGRYRLILKDQLQAQTLSRNAHANNKNNRTSDHRSTVKTTTEISQEPNVKASSENSSTQSPATAAPPQEHNKGVQKISFVAWPLRRGPASRKFRPLLPSTTTRRPLVKLIRPRPTRPAMYSLDGFVPRPSLKKILTTTTESSSYSFLERSFKGKFDLQALDSVQKKRKVRFRNEVRARPDDKKKFGSREQHRKKRPVTRHRAFAARKGVAGKDFPIHGSVPETRFECDERTGMFADPQTGCQAWHLCPGGRNPHRHSFLCPNGTIFSEGKGVCDWWYNVDCPSSE